MVSPVGGGAARQRLVVPFRPRSGPFGPHLGLDGPVPSGAAASGGQGRWPELSMVVVAARVLQHPDGGFTSTGQVGLCLAGPGGPGMPLVGMSGLVPPLAVEVVPSCVSNTSPFLGFGILLGPSGFGSLVAV
jgi:hypothetical protein